MTTPKAVVLLSGGLDSTTCLTLAARDYDCYPITFAYGQRHNLELGKASQVAQYLGIDPARHLIVDLGRTLRGSALTGDAEVPTGRDPAEIGSDIPVTYVPARNLVFLSLAASYAEAVGAGDIFIGVNALDYSGYPDCRPEFIEAFEGALRAGTRAGVEGRPIRVQTPLLHRTKAEIIRLGHKLGAPYHLTYSCYQGTEPSCGNCDACILRRQGFREAGLQDPIAYRGGSA